MNFHEMSDEELSQIWREHDQQQYSLSELNTVQSVLEDRGYVVDMAEIVRINNLTGLSGWLFLIAVEVVFALAGYLINAFILGSVIIKHIDEIIITGQDMLMLAFIIIRMLFLIVCTVTFFMKKPITRILFIIFFAVDLVIGGYSFLVEIPGYGLVDLVRNVLGLFISCCIIGYWIRSERVKYTFRIIRPKFVQ